MTLEAESTWSTCKQRCNAVAEQERSVGVGAKPVAVRGAEGDQHQLSVKEPERSVLVGGAGVNRARWSELLAPKQAASGCPAQ